MEGQDICRALPLYYFSFPVRNKCGRIVAVHDSTICCQRLNLCETYIGVTVEGINFVERLGVQTAERGES